MSEFTNGVLFLTRDEAHVAPLAAEAPDEFRVQPLNDRWAVLLLADGWLGNPATVQALALLSHKAPLLYFTNAEDHGWGYRLFHQGDETAFVEVSYDLQFNLAMVEFEERYPDADPFEDPENQARFDTLMEAIAQSPDYQNAVAEQYANANPEALQVLAIGDDALQELKALLSAQSAATHWEQVEAFKRLMGFPEMSWVSFDYE